MNELNAPAQRGCWKIKLAECQVVQSVDRTQNTNFMVRCRLMNLLTQRC